MGNWVYELISLSTSDGKKRLVGKLEYASNMLLVAETLDSFASNDLQHLRKLRGGLNKTIEVLNMPDTVLKNLEASMQIVDAIQGLDGKISDDPVKAARAFGKLFAGLGKLAEYMPPPVRYYVQLFEGAEEFFSNMQIKIVPHMRPTNRHVADQVKQSDNIDIWAPL